MHQRRAWAEQLFLVWPDLTSLLVLLVAVTGRNIESIKELPAEHRILEGRAVELRLTKRRRGRRAWQETVTWEIGPPHRALHTPGGLYLLTHRLTARGRGSSGDSSIWSVWRNGNRAGKHGVDEHIDPFRAGLHSEAHYRRRPKNRHSTAPQHDRSDDVDDVELDALSSVGPDAGDDDVVAAPCSDLRIDFIRLKTSIEVRRTRQMGGHLPSAARSNTFPVLFANYLRDDPTTIDWARDVLDDALLDAEAAALDAHRRTLAATGAHPALTVHHDPTELADPADPIAPTSATASLDAGLAVEEAGELHADDGGAGSSAGGADGADSGWSRCSDPAHHPVTDTACRASLLDCFHCANAVITRAHLPRLLDLLDALAQRQAQMPETEWWTRYGPAWAAIRHDVLPAFTPAELEHAAIRKPGEALLDLVENPWEQP